MEQPITPASFGRERHDYQAEVIEQAVEIATRLRAENPERDLSELLQEALDRAQRWYLDRAG